MGFNGRIPKKVLFMDVIQVYATTLWVALAMGGLLLVQVVISDLISIRAKHKPGFPVQPDHGSLLVRAARVYANTNETIAAFALFVIVGVHVAANPAWLNGFALVYLAGRVGHMLCYYLGQPLLRSIGFGVSLLGLFGMFVVVAAAMLGS